MFSSIITNFGAMHADKAFEKKAVNLVWMIQLLKEQSYQKQARKDTKHGTNDLPCCLLLLVL
jgi:hypothetical protein